MSILDLTQSVEQSIEEIEANIGADGSNREVYRQAVMDFSLLLNKEPFNGRIYRHRGHRHLSLSNVEQAIGDLSLSTRIEPEYWKSWDLLGMAFYYLGDFEKALSNYRQGLRVTGLQSRFTAPLLYWSYISLCQLGRRDTEEARSLLQMVDAADPATESLYLWLIRLFRNECTPQDVYDYEKEYEDKQRAAGGSIDYLTGTFGYGIAAKYYFDGHKDKAKEVMEDVVKSGQDWNAWGYIACQKDLKRWF